MSSQSFDPSSCEGDIPWQEHCREARFRRGRRIAARRFGWGGAGPVRHSAADRPRFGFHRCVPWGRSRRFDHAKPWHRRGWLRQIAEETRIPD